MVLIPRDGDHKGQTVRLVFGGRAAEERGAGEHRDASSCRATRSTVERITLDAPLITALVTSEGARSAATCRCRPSRSQMIQAVLAIEDRRFYDHSGVDPIGIAGAVFRNIFGSKAYLAAAAPSPSSSSRTRS